MADKFSKRRMAENEVVFRSYNERVEQDFAALKQMAKEDNQKDILNISDDPLHFYCECSNENCVQRVRIKPSTYTAIHKNRDQFVIVCGHNVPAIEHVIEGGEEFCIVEKFEVPDEAVSKLRDTPLNHE